MRRIPQNLMGVSTYDNIRKGAGIVSLMLGVGNIVGNLNPGLRFACPGLFSPTPPGSVLAMRSEFCDRN